MPRTLSSICVKQLLFGLLPLALTSLLYPRIAIRRYSDSANPVPLTTIALCLIVLVICSSAAFAQSFGAPVDYPTGSLPYAAALGDFNGDGIRDMATANNSARSVSVLLGNGVATFGAKTDYDLGSGPEGIVTMDLNGDNKLDLATASYFGPPAKVSVLLGNGNGTFQNRVDYPFNGLPEANSILSADFNGDSKPDLVVANTSGATVFIGNGDGTLSSPVNYGSGNFVGSVTVGDFNADSKIDLVFPNYGVSNNGVVSVMLGNGNGTFQAQVDYPVAPSPFAIGTTDFNGDGKLDLATVNIQVNSISVLLGNGNGTFQSAANYSTSANPFGIAFGDFNVDGKVDVLVPGNGGGLTVLAGNGDGTFRGPRPFQVGGSFGTVADLNGDSKPDIVSAGPQSAVSVLLNQTGPYSINGVVKDSNNVALPGVSVFLAGGALEIATTDSSGAYAFHDLQAGGNFTVTPTKSNYSFAPTNVSITNLSSNVVADFTGTLLTYSISGAVRDTFGNPMSGVTVTLTGSQSNSFITASDGMYSFPNLPGGGNYTVTPSLAKFAFTPPSGTLTNLSANRVRNFTGSVATFTISGKVTDLITGSNIENVTVLLSGSKFATAVTTFFGYSFSGLPVDGDYTVTAYSSAGNALFTNVIMVAPVSQSFPGLSANVTANFTARRLSFDPGNLDPAGLAQADLNGDGKLDLAVATTNGSNIHVLIGNGDGTFQTQVPYLAGANPLTVVIGDFNADGKLDIASANYSSQDVSIFIGNGDGTFQTHVNYAIGNIPSALSVSDLNGDGKKDLAILATNNNLGVLLGNGDGTFKPVITKQVPTAVGSVSTADLNGDSKPDVVLGASSNSVLVLLGNGDGTFADAVSYGVGSDVHKVTLADVNADGKLDLAVAAFRAFVILTGKGDGTFQPGTPTSLVGDPTEIITGEFDGDGLIDLVIGNNNGGAYFVSGNGDATFKTPVVYQAGSYTASLVAGDFDNNGALDFVIASLGESRVNVMLNTSLTRPPALQFSASNYDVVESAGSVTVTITRSGPVSGAARVNYATTDSSGSQACNVNNGIASSHCDYENTLGTLFFAPGETSKTVSILLVDDAYAENTETFFLNLSNEFGANLGQRTTAVIRIADNESANGPNPIDQANYFVRLHYLDFLNREPDAPGLAYWSNQITECQQPGATCNAEIRRINVSAAFFLSIEFQETGYLVERIYKTAYGDADALSALDTYPTQHSIKAPIVRLNEFLADSQQISKDVQVGVGNWQAQIEANKVAFTQDFVARARFVGAFPTTRTPAEFVDKLFLNAAVTPSASERSSIINEFGGAGNTADTVARARVLRRVAENTVLAQQERNKAFVLMQYFGYLRRNPNDPQDTDHTGYDFWLHKLDQFNGNFESAQMVQAFIDSIEYRTRFAP